MLIEAGCAVLSAECQFVQEACRIIASAVEGLDVYRYMALAIVIRCARDAGTALISIIKQHAIERSVDDFGLVSPPRLH